MQPVSCPVCQADNYATVSYYRFNRIVNVNNCGMMYTSRSNRGTRDEYYESGPYAQLENVPDVNTSKESERGAGRLILLLKH